MTSSIANTYCSLLRRELLVSQGCTEPAAIAYAAAMCRKQLGKMPDHMRVSCSGNVFKNAKSAILPHTDGLKGIAAAAIAGAVGEKAELELEVLASLTSEHLAEIHRLLADNFCEVTLLKSDEKLHIIVEETAGEDSASVEICHEHTFIKRIKFNGSVVSQSDIDLQETDYTNEELSRLNMHDIFCFACEVDLSDELRFLLRKQLLYNVKICEEGLSAPWGSSIGRLLREGHEHDVERMACAFAAAGSDARMSGCPLPVVITSGSGNQGITVTAPVYIYAKHLDVDEERLLRALIISNLFSLYQKSMIGRLSAYCGAVSAACGAGAAITYLCGGNYKQIVYTFANVASGVAGILCDGAKPSCAMKIAIAVNAAIIGHKMAMTNNNFRCGDGIVGDSPEATVRSVGMLAREGLVDIDDMMLEIMLNT